MPAEFYYGCFWRNVELSCRLHSRIILKCVFVGMFREDRKWVTVVGVSCVDIVLLSEFVTARETEYRLLISDLDWPPLGC